MDDSISAELVSEYVSIASKYAKGKGVSHIEKAAVREAIELGNQVDVFGTRHFFLSPAGRFTRYTFDAARSAARKKRRPTMPKKNPAIEIEIRVPADQEFIARWKAAILKEIRKALCTKTSRYRKEVAALKENGRLLIVGIAGYMAGKLGVAVAVVSALVAVMLRLVLMIGLEAFCEATKP